MKRIILAAIIMGISVYIVYLLAAKYPAHTSVPDDTVFCKRCNIILISLDTLRADHVHTLGYERQTTPAIDAVAESGFAFTQAIAVSSWTLPSSMSMLTGTYPSRHHVTNKFTVQPEGTEEMTNLRTVAPGMMTIAQILRENGYTTGGFTGGAAVFHGFGFDTGFDVYADAGETDFGGLTETIPKALEWISGHKDDHLFVYLQGYDTHGQYIPRGGYDQRFVDFSYNGKLTGSAEEQKALREEGINTGHVFLTGNDVRFLTALYDEKIRRADEHIARFVSEYQKLGIMGKTVFIITASHGEELYDHGRIDHGHSLYDELIRVPLILSIPGTVSRKKIPEQVRTIDLLPTILDIVQATVSARVARQMQGVSLVPFLQGRKLSLDVFPETDYRYATSQRAIRTWDGWKLIEFQENGVKELYNTRADSLERKNEASRSLKKTEALEKLLNMHLKQFSQ